MIAHRLAVAGVALVVAAACSRTEEPKKQAAQPPSQAAPSAPPAAPAAKPLAEADFQAGGVRVALLEVKRSSTGVTARWQYRNETDKVVSASIGGTVGGDQQRPARHAYLLDGATKTKHPVVEDTNGKLVAAQHGEMVHAFKLKPKETLNTWAKFGAIPETSKRVTIVIAGTAPFEDVPVE